MSDPIYYFAWIPYCFKTNMTKQTMVRVFCGYSENVDRTYADHCRNNPVKNQPAGWLDKIRLFISPNSVGKQFPAFYDYWGTTIARKCWLPADVATLRLRTALRLYELKHAQLPDDLSALVPEYLQEIPRDPYDGKPVRYSKAEKKLWTVGRDLTDNGGKMENGEEMQDSPGCDLVMPLGTREMKPTLAFPPVINEWGN